MRQATENDLRAIEILLEANDLPNIHLAPYIKQFMVVETDDNVLIGVIGLHTTGKKALLRSFAVSVSRRNCGIGLMLVQHGNDYLFVGTIGTITGGKNSRYIGFAIFIYDNFTERIQTKGIFQPFCIW